MSIYTAFRCPEDLLAKAKARAAKERRSLSNYIITLLDKDAGNDPAPPAQSKAKAVKTAKTRRKA